MKKTIICKEGNVLLLGLYVTVQSTIGTGLFTYFSFVKYLFLHFTICLLNPFKRIGLIKQACSGKETGALLTNNTFY